MDKATPEQVAWKALLRKRTLMARASLPEGELKSRSRKIIDRFQRLPEYKSAITVMFYVSFRAEVVTHQAIAEALLDGKRVVVPACLNLEGQMMAFEITGMDDLIPGTMGILEPRIGEAPQVGPEEIDLVVVPGAAFDHSGARIGMGGGYYDRFMSGLRTEALKVALAFDLQVVDRVPAEPHDINVDAVVTENWVVRPGQQAQDEDASTW